MILPALIFMATASSWDLSLAAPIKTWDEGLPLGNGELGALVWGEGQTLNLSLDRGDLWDLRHAPEISESGFNYRNLQKLVADKNMAEIGRLFDEPYNRQTPTKLPGFRLQLSFAPSVEFQKFNLSFGTGLAEVETTRGPIQAAIDPNRPVLVGEATQAPVADFRFVRPTVLGNLGYPAAETGDERSGEVEHHWIKQQTLGDLAYCACVAVKRSKAETKFAVSFVTNFNQADPIKKARSLADQALRHSLQNRVAAKLPSTIHVPDPDIQRLFDEAMYLYRAGAKRGQPPIPLQGLWTADDGGLPPWKGDFHHDLNTQLTYWPSAASGNFEALLGMTDFLWAQLPQYRRFAEEYFHAPGAAIPGVAALDGSPLTGWGQYSLSPTMGPWIAMTFVDYWRTTQDQGFLKSRAYPFCAELGLCLQSLLSPTGGKLVLPLSSSPEIHDNSLEAFLKPNSNFDLAILKGFFRALAEMATSLGKKADSEKWTRLDHDLGNPLTDAQGLLVAQDQELQESHRHFSHLMAIHPFDLITEEGSDEERKVIDASLAHLKSLGTQAWCGYSFSWAACLYARCRRPEEALRNLDIFTHAFVLRNGFHANGDQSGKGYSGFTYRPFTLEGNFAAAEAVQDMLLQSWGGIVRLFPACPWHEASFSGLRAQGGFVVSAALEQGQIKKAQIRATTGHRLVVLTPHPLKWKTPAGIIETQKLEINLRKGQSVEVVQD